MSDTITVNGIEYVPKSEVAPVGPRHVVVADKGFIWVGNAVWDENRTTLTLTSVKNLRRWKSGGFGGALRDPKASGVELDDAINMTLRAEAVISMHRVSQEWGQ